MQLTGVPALGRRHELTYQWLADGAPVDGATGLDVHPGPGQAGAAITVAVTGTKAGYAPVTKTSAATAPVAAGRPGRAPRRRRSPAPPKVGVALTAQPGDWDAGTTLSLPVVRRRQHRSTGATCSTFTPGAGAARRRHHRRGHRHQGRLHHRTQHQRARRRGRRRRPVSTPTPTITGTPQVGVPLDRRTRAPGTTARPSPTSGWPTATPIDGRDRHRLHAGAGKVGAVLTFAGDRHQGRLRDGDEDQRGDRSGRRR